MRKHESCPKGNEAKKLAFTVHLLSGNSPDKDKG